VFGCACESHHCGNPKTRAFRPSVESGTKKWKRAVDGLQKQVLFGSMKLFSSTFSYVTMVDMLVSLVVTNVASKKVAPSALGASKIRMKNVDSSIDKNNKQ
jgi:hypothetical protein